MSLVVASVLAAPLFLIVRRGRQRRLSIAHTTVRIAASIVAFALGYLVLGVLLLAIWSLFGSPPNL